MMNKQILLHSHWTKIGTFIGSLIGSQEKLAQPISASELMQNLYENR